MSSVKSRSVPADFGKNDMVLLVMKEGARKADAVLEQYFAKYYKGKYVLITADEGKKLDSTPYADKTKYPYVFYRSVSYKESYSSKSTGRGYNSTTLASSNYRLLRRQDSTRYGPRVTSGLYGKLLKAYLYNLEKTRKANNP